MNSNSEQKLRGRLVDNAIPLADLEALSLKELTGEGQSDPIMLHVTSPKDVTPKLVNDLVQSVEKSQVSSEYNGHNNDTMGMGGRINQDKVYVVITNQNPALDLPEETRTVIAARFDEVYADLMKEAYPKYYDPENRHLELYFHDDDPHMNKFGLSEGNPIEKKIDDFTISAPSETGKHFDRDLMGETPVPWKDHASNIQAAYNKLHKQKVDASNVTVDDISEAKDPNRGIS